MSAAITPDTPIRAVPVHPLKALVDAAELDAEAELATLSFYEARHDAAIKAGVSSFDPSDPLYARVCELSERALVLMARAARLRIEMENDCG